MEVRLEQVSKRFEGRTILEDLNFHLGPGEPTLISGPNGSGKSTLLKLIAAFLRPSEGTVQHLSDGSPIEPEEAYRSMALAAPYLQLPADLTVMENIRTWQRFRGLESDAERIPEMVDLEEAKDRPVRELSSGMEQRLKLGIAFASTAPLLLLDEPLTNIDAEGRSLYHELLSRVPKERSVLICSNDPEQEAPEAKSRYRIEEGRLHPLT